MDVYEFISFWMGSEYTVGVANPRICNILF